MTNDQRRRNDEAQRAGFEAARSWDSSFAIRISFVIRISSFVIFSVGVCLCSPGGGVADRLAGRRRRAAAVLDFSFHFSQRGQAGGATGTRAVMGLPLED